MPRLTFLASPFDPLLLLEVEGYLVDAMPDEPVGVVDEVIVDDDGRPVALVVACGWFGRRDCRIDVEDIHDICPESRRLRVRRTARSIAAELHHR
jgi:hypothetical protein